MTSQGHLHAVGAMSSLCLHLLDGVEAHGLISTQGYTLSPKSRSSFMDSAPEYAPPANRKMPNNNKMMDRITTDKKMGAALLTCRTPPFTINANANINTNAEIAQSHDPLMSIELLMTENPSKSISTAPRTYMLAAIVVPR